MSLKICAPKMRQLLLENVILRTRKHKLKFVSFPHPLTKVTIQRDNFRCYFNTVVRVKENHTLYKIRVTNIASLY